MTEKHSHLSDETLLLLAGQELSAERGADAEVHLAYCATCNTRLEEITAKFKDFTHSYRQTLDVHLPPFAESRENLRLRLAEMGANPPRKIWFSWVGLALTPSRGGYVLASLVLISVLTGAVYRREIKSRSQEISVSLGLWPEPKTNLTPGLALPLTAAQVCAASSGEREVSIPVSLKSKVSTIYGVSAAPPDAYEVDYLITPELGGATDVRNLWPEPYYNTAWNAHVKDQLEDHLHDMVCGGKLDLATAQQDISKDWIAAYRKYFHTDHPLADKPLLHRS